MPSFRWVLLLLAHSCSFNSRAFNVVLHLVDFICFIRYASAFFSLSQSLTETHIHTHAIQLQCMKLYFNFTQHHSQSQCAKRLRNGSCFRKNNNKKSQSNSRMHINLVVPHIAKVHYHCASLLNFKIRNTVALIRNERNYIPIPISELNCFCGMILILKVLEKYRLLLSKPNNI